MRRRNFSRGHPLLVTNWRVSHFLSLSSRFASSGLSAFGASHQTHHVDTVQDSTRDPWRDPIRSLSLKIGPTAPKGQASGTHKECSGPRMNWWRPARPMLPFFANFVHIVRCQSQITKPSRSCLPSITSHLARCMPPCHHHNGCCPTVSQVSR